MLAGPQPSTRVLRRLTSLRALAALAVFAYHLNLDGVLRLPDVVSFGYTGVAFFFILSGFVLAWSTPASMSNGVFWRNRFARIYPATAVSMLAAFALPAPTPHPALAPVLQFALVHSWVPSSGYLYSGNVVTWSLSCEAFFYLVFPLLVVQLRRADRRTRLAVAGGYWIAASVVVLFGSIPGHSAALHDLAYTNPAVRLGEFLVGLVLALELRDGRRLGWRGLGLLAATSAGLIVVTRASPFPDVALAPFFAAVVVWAAQRDLDRPRGLMAVQPLVIAGELSFCLYLVHDLVILNLFHGVGHGGWLVALAALALSVVAAGALHYGVERPVQTLIRGREAARRSIGSHADQPAARGPGLARPAVASPADPTQQQA